MGDLSDDFDLVFYQSHLFILNWIMAIKLRSVKRRVWMNHGCNYVPLNSRVGNWLSFLYERLGMAIMKSLCNEFVGQSKNTAEWIALKVGIPFQVLSNAINMQPFSGEIELESRKVKKNVLFVGRLVEGKGLLNCISAVSKANHILKHNGDLNLLTLTVVGSGPLKYSISNNESPTEIFWRGELSHSQVIASMYQSDILIQAYSQPEGLTTVTLEGLAAGMLIVTTPVSGEGDLDGCINYVPGSLAELPYLLLKSRDRAEKRSDLVSTGKWFIEAGFTWDIIAEKLIFRDYSNI
jgi:glycosyltransferase involved in cell wall biosynthesis